MYISQIGWVLKGLFMSDRITADWLYVRIDPTSPLGKLRLQDGTHHFVEEIHHYSPTEKIHSVHQMTSSCPLEYPLKDPGVVLIKVVSLPHSRPPSATEARELHCATVTGWHDTAYPITGDVVAADRPGASGLDPGGLPDAMETMKRILAAHASGDSPVVRLRSGTTAFSVQLTFPCQRPVAVYPVLSEFTAETVNSSPCRPKSKVVYPVGRGTPSMVSPHTLKPSPVLPATGWSLALPIELDPDAPGPSPSRGVVGHPFAGGPIPLLGNFELDYTIRGLILQLDWNAPADWMEIFLWWNYFDDGQARYSSDDARNALNMKLSYREYSRDTRRFTLPPDIGASLKGGTVQVVAEPLIFGEQTLEDQTKHDYYPKFQY